MVRLWSGRAHHPSSATGADPDPGVVVVGATLHTWELNGRQGVLMAKLPQEHEQKLNSILAELEADMLTLEQKCHEAKAGGDPEAIRASLLDGIQDLQAKVSHVLAEIGRKPIN